jgi:hypothetical protein
MFGPAKACLILLSRSMSSAALAIIGWLHGVRVHTANLLSLAFYHGANGIFSDSCQGGLAVLQAGLLSAAFLRTVPDRFYPHLVKQVCRTASYGPFFTALAELLQLPWNCFSRSSCLLSRAVQLQCGMLCSRS